MSDAVKKTQKKGIDHDESRRRRTETTIQVRKGKKDELLSKRRSPTYTSSLTPEQLEQLEQLEKCFSKIQDKLINELSQYIKVAENGVIYLNKVTGFLYGNKEILYEPNQNVMQNGMPGQTTQTMINTDISALLEQDIPFKVIIMNKSEVSQNTDKMIRQYSFNAKNNLTLEQSGKLSVAFLLNMYLNPHYVNINKDEIRKKLIALDICNPEPGSIIDWSKYIFILMPGVHTDFTNSSLQMVVGGGAKRRKNKTKRRRTKSKRMKTRRRRR
jgi:hypothetical protein